MAVADEAQVAKNKATLSKAAVANYISDGTASAQNPIFSGNEQTLGATTEYNKVAEGDISLAVDNLHSAENTLDAQVSQLQGEQSVTCGDPGAAVHADRRCRREQCQGGGDRKPSGANGKGRRHGDRRRRTTAEADVED